MSFIVVVRNPRVSNNSAAARSNFVLVTGPLRRRSGGVVSSRAVPDLALRTLLVIQNSPDGQNLMKQIQRWRHPVIRHGARTPVTHPSRRTAPENERPYT